MPRRLRSCIWTQAQNVATPCGVSGPGANFEYSFPIGKILGALQPIRTKIPDREISLARSQFVVDNFPNGKLSKP